MHILDLIMYFVLCILLWWLMEKIFDGEITQELGGLVGFFVMIIFTVVYVIVFCFWPDLNWIDIFRNAKMSIVIKW